MSMFDQIMKVNESSQVSFEPEIQDITIESAEDLNAATDIMEDALNITFENDMFMQRMNLAIISEEYEYLRNNGEELVWESGKLANIRDTFVGWVKTFLGKIAGLFKKALRAIDEKAHSNKKWLAMECKDKEVKLAKGFNPMCLRADGIQTRAEGVFNSLSDLIDKFSVDAWSDGDVKVADSKEIKDADEALKKLENDMYTQGEYTYDVSTAKQFLASYSGLRKGLNKLYDDIKKTANGIIRDMKDMCKDEKKEKGDKDVHKANSAAVHKFMSLSKEVLNRGSKILNVFMKSAGKSNQLARAVVSKAASGKTEKAADNAPQEKKHEAASVFDTVMEAYI